MEDQEFGEAAPVDGNVGAMLVRAREAAGLSREDIAARTRIAERHLIALEQDRLGDFAAKTYAVGFARAYAKAVGLDETMVANKVRGQLEPRDYQPRPMATFEPGDPARVPSSALAWLAGGAVIAVVVALYFAWSSLFSPQAELPSLIEDAPPAATKPAPARPAAPAARGVVALRALAPGVWVKVIDAQGSQLVQKELAQGEVYTVPADARGATLRTGRPDVLEVSIDGVALPRLADRPVTLGAIPLDADALRARFAGSSASPAASMPAATNPPAASGPPPAVTQTPIPTPRAQDTRTPTRTPANGTTPAPAPAARETSPPSPAPAASSPSTAPSVSTVSE